VVQNIIFQPVRYSLPKALLTFPAIYPNMLKSTASFLSVKRRVDHKTQRM